MSEGVSLETYEFLGGLARGAIRAMRYDRTLNMVLRLGRA